MLVSRDSRALSEPGAGEVGGSKGNTTMRPYQNIKLDAYPDVADGKNDGRKASEVNVSVRGGKARSNTKNALAKAAARRHLKRVDKAAAARRIMNDAE